MCFAKANKFALIGALGLLPHAVVLAATPAAPACTDALLGKESCQTGVTVRCEKHFDMGSKAMQYSWDYVNATGQAFKTNPKLLNTTPGYTPKACTETSAATGAAQDGRKKG
jgi:hypothetical protein